MVHQPAKRAGVLVLLMWLSITASGISFTPQAGYKEKVSEQGVTIFYKWRRACFLRKNSPFVLVLKIENTNSYSVAISFKTEYYWKAQLHSDSGIRYYCLRPGRSIRGKRWNLIYRAEIANLENYPDPMFSWFVEDFEVRKSKACTPGAALHSKDENLKSPKQP